MKKSQHVRAFRFYTLFLHKAYFDRGWALTNYFKYLFAFVGIFELINVSAAIWIGIAYVIFCYFAGMFFYKFGLVDVENEIANKFNPFQREVRKHLNKLTSTKK